MDNGVFVGYGILGSILQSRVFVDVQATTGSGGEAIAGAIINFYAGGTKVETSGGSPTYDTDYSTINGIPMFLTGRIASVEGTPSISINPALNKLETSFSHTDNGSLTTGDIETGLYEETYNTSASVSLDITFPDLEFYTYS